MKGSRCNLTFKTGPLAGRTYSLGPGEQVLVGGAADCPIRIADDPTVGHYHAKFHYEDDKIRVEDLGTPFGTTRNGSKISGSAVINAGDRVSFGRISTLQMSWWNALQHTRMTQLSAFVSRVAPLGGLGGGTGKKPVVAVLAVLFLLLAAGGTAGFMWKKKIAVKEAATAAAAAEAAEAKAVKVAEEQAPAETPKKKKKKDKKRKKKNEVAEEQSTTASSTLSNDRKFIWDEIVTISRKFGDPPPSSMDVSFVAEVERNIKDYTSSGRHKVLLERQKKYWPLITKMLSDKGMPKDLGYVVWVESEFVATAKSPVQAAGLWQLMPPTARDYGLTVSTGRDDRLDPAKSTTAAISYMTDLLRMFKNRYLLALASYNTGQMRVKRVQLAESLGNLENADFWGVRHKLSKETNAYVPRIMAAAIIGRNAKRWTTEPDKPVPLAH